MPENSCHNIGIDMICNIYHIANQRITPPEINLLKFHSSIQYTFT